MKGGIDKVSHKRHKQVKFEKAKKEGVADDSQYVSNLIRIKIPSSTNDATSSDLRGPNLVFANPQVVSNGGG